MGTYLITITFYLSIFFLLAVQTKRQPYYFISNEPGRSISSASFSYEIALWSLILLPFPYCCAWKQSLCQDYGVRTWICTFALDDHWYLFCAACGMPKSSFKEGNTQILHLPWPDFGKNKCWVSAASGRAL